MGSENDRYKIRITPAEIEKYLRGQLDGKAMHAIERQAMDDPFLAEALEGYAKHPPDQSVQLTELGKRLQKRLAEGENENHGSLISIHRRHRWSAAAALLLLLIGTSVYFFTQKTPGPENVLARRIQNPEAKASRASQNAPSRDTVSATLTASGENPHGPGDRSSHPPASPEQVDRGKAFAKRNLTVSGPLPPDTTQEYAYHGGLPRRAEENSAGNSSPTARVSASPLTLRQAMKPMTKEQKMTRGVLDDSILVTGQVRTAKDLQPAAGVTIHLAGKNTGTRSDRGGHFTLKLPAAPESLQVAYIGYEPQQVRVDGASRDLQILLKPSASSSREVVVGHVSQKAQGDQLSAFPEGGNAAFSKYLKDSTRYPPEALESRLEGEVTLSFRVMADSTLQQIKVTGSLGPLFDQEAIRLLREGPRWIPAKNGQPSDLQVVITFTPPPP